MSPRPHIVLITLAATGDVKYAKCSCVAGTIGYCNHTMTLLYMIDHTIKIGAETFPKVGTCTDNPQQWHKPRTMGIKAESIMGYNVINLEYHEKPSSGIKCSLYEARKPLVQNNDGVQQLKDKLSQQFPNLGFSQCAIQILKIFHLLSYICKSHYEVYSVTS